MKILKIYQEGTLRQTEKRRIAMDLWDLFDGDRILRGELKKYNKSYFDKYDIIFSIPINRYSKQPENMDVINKMKDSKARIVLFESDSCYNSFNDPLYDNIDFIFYRCLDKNGNTPSKNSQWLPWSVNTNRFTAKYGGKGIAFCCTISKAYPLRMEISKIMNHIECIGDDYIRLLQNSGAAIHTVSEIVNKVRAKILEFASCGTQIISNRTENMNYYYPDELITYFDTVDNLKEIIKRFRPNIEIQKELRYITELKHTHKIRSKMISDIINNL